MKLHLGSWRRHTVNNFWLYRELADQLVRKMDGLHPILNCR